MSIVVSPLVTSGPRPIETEPSSVTSVASFPEGENEIDSSSSRVDELERSNSALYSSSSSFASSKLQPSADVSETNRSKPHSSLTTGYDNLIQNSTNSKSPELKELALQALGLINREDFTFDVSRQVENSKILIEPILLACKAFSKTLNRISLSIITELLTQSYLSRDTDFDEDDFRTEKTPLEQAVVGICSVHTLTDEKNVTNILKAVILAISYGKIRQDTLMGLIRTLYSIYATSDDVNNQVIAQMSLLQLSQLVFSRVSLKEESKPKSVLDEESMRSLSTLLGLQPEQPQTLKPVRNMFELEAPHEAKVETLTIKQMGSPETEKEADSQVQLGICNVNSDLRVVDAYLVFHSFCKLSLKEYRKEFNSEMRHTILRAKFLALFAIITLLSEFPQVIAQGKLVFLTTKPDELPRGFKEVSFIEAIRPFLGAVLAKNLDHPVPKVYELSLAVFEAVVTNLWEHFKLETEAVMRDVVFPILERKEPGNMRTKHTLHTILLSKICQSPRLLLSFYLAYDCAPNGARTKVFYQLANSLSRLAVALGRGNRVADSYWDHHDSFQKASRQMDRYDLLKLPPFTTDRFVDNYSSRSFFSRYTYVDNVLHYRCAAALYDITESLTKIANCSLDACLPDPVAESQEGIVDVEGLTPSEAAPLLFKQAPRNAIAYLIAQGVIASDAASGIARFLFETPNLDKSKLGIYLCEGSSILRAFIGLMDFDGLELVTALRRFMAKFWFPTSAKSIDTLLLSFAERYAEQNPSSFPNADTIYALCYAAITLSISLHSPLVKWRMKKDDFIDSTRGIDHGSDVCRDILGEMYDQIHTVAIPIRDPLVEPTSQRSGDFQWISDEFQSLALPPQDWVEEYFTRMLRFRPPQNDIENSTLFKFSPEALVTRQMFQALWMPSFAAASHMSKFSMDNDAMAGAAAIFRRQILLSRELGEETAYNTLYSYTCSFYNHDGSQAISYRNAFAVLDLFYTVGDSANRMRAFWPKVIHTVRRMLKDGFVHCYSGRVEKERILTIYHLEDPKDICASLEDLTFTQRILLALDKIFYSSPKLSGTGIVDLVSYLTLAATEDLADLPASFNCQQNPREIQMFFINRIVDVAFFNMSRIRVEWKALWTVLGPFFSRLGCHSNTSVAQYCIRFLQDLAIHHLAQSELPRFKYQRDVLSPLVYIISNAPSIFIKESALKTMQVILKSHALQLHSGWESMFQALTGSAGCLSAELLRFSFQMAQDIAVHHRDVLTDGTLLKSYLNCLSHFARNTVSPDISIQAVELFNDTAMNIVKGHTAEPVEGNPWATVFCAASNMILEVPLPEVCDKAISVLFSWLNDYGVSFSGQFWEYMLNQILFPLFSQLGQCTQRDTEWVTHTLSLALNKLMEIFTLHFDLLFQYVDGLLDLLSVCLCQQDPARSKVGADCLQQLLEGNIERMAEKDWQRILSIIIRLFQASSAFDPDVLSSNKPRYAFIQQLKSFEVSAPLPLAPSTLEQCNHLCLTVTTLVEKAFLQNPKVFSRLEPDFTFIILDLVEHAYAKSHHQNISFDMATAIHNQSVLKLERFAKKDLTLELNSLVCLIKVLLRMYTSKDEAYEAYSDEIVQRLVPLCRDTFSRFNALSSYPMVPGIKEIYDQWHSVVLRVGHFLCISSGQEFRLVFTPISSEVILTLKHQHLSKEVLAMLSTIMGRVNDIYIHQVDSIPDPTTSDICS
ncbi:guanine nucleotide exchange protein for ADP-robosylation factor [Entomophthora muscae]|uniref:Guanine nucleotide exchange protein for ADP-robosylation factor n=1 Tax=Entomophthora muscae TaxID=34485 RepID=A0ACC2SM52_9FUNG|nr:guanine nucleotide exchange protein for ADP-robosylation factor [Entomophthora muscae]